MQERILLVAYVHEAGVEMWQYLPDPSKVDVSHSVLLIPLFAVEFREDFFLEQSNVHALSADIDNQFDVTCQC